MARKFIGLPLGGMIALCAILLSAPDTHGQAPKIMKRTFTISGTVGPAGVTMQGFPAGTSVMTDENGVYTGQVEYNWSGTIKPVKPGYTFLPPEKAYTKVTSNLTKEDYKPTALTYTITGSVGMPSVKMIGFPDEVVSDQAGMYKATVVYNWSSTVMPEKAGYRFEPSNRSYNQVVKDMKDENYKPYELTFTISGVTAPGVVMKGLPNDPTSAPDGSYRAEVRHGWSGKVKPTKEGTQFTPEERAYASVTEAQPNQDYAARIFTYQITGTAGMAGVVMKGLPEDPMTDNNGLYTATVQHGWSGKVTPEKVGYKFEPPSRDFPKTVANRENQDFKASVIYLTVAGSVGTGGVTLAGLPGDPQGDSTGTYMAKVQYGWNGTLTPKKDGWSFEPPSRDYASLTQDQLKQDFKTQAITFKITGNISVPQVVLQGLPGNVTTGADGSYSADVPWNWSGTVLPKKDGYTFDPASREYKELQMAQSSQDYAARVVQHSIPGRVLDEASKPVADVSIVADGEGGSTVTNANGQFELKVNHRWQGKLTFQKDGYTFTPPTRSILPVTQDMPEVVATAKVRVLTIADRIVFNTGTAEEPIAGVKVTPIPPGKNPAVTDVNGKYVVRVPYGWTGVLEFSKPDLVFDPNTKPFTNVTTDVDNTNPRSSTTQPPQTTTPPPTQATTAPPTQTTTAPPAQTTTAPTTQMNDQKLADLQVQRKALEDEAAALKKQGKQVPTDLQQKINDVKKEQGRVMAQSHQSVTPPPDQGTPVPAGPDLYSVLLDLSRRTGVSITWDATVKPEPVAIPSSVYEGKPLATALQMIVTSFNPPYALAMEDNARAFKVYRPITNQFPDVDLTQALQDLSASTGVTIIADPNVTGKVNVNITDASLDEALEMLLAGKPYMFKKMPDAKNPRFYLVAERSITSRIFQDISETRRVRLNYIQAPRAKAMLSPVFLPYVMAEPTNSRDPNDFGNTLLITAAPNLVDRIMDDIKKIDVFKRQVLLDARVVTMERGDLLNLGVEWSWPTIKAGTFTDSAGTTDTAGNTFVRSGWPYGMQIGYAPDRTFTNSLMMALNLLQENSQADIIANPKVVAQDGRQAEMRVIQEEWFMMQANQTNQFFYQNAQLQKIESGTVLTITPYIGDNNDITLTMAVEVSDSIPKARGSDLPLVTRRTAKNSVTVRDGGTVAVGGLTENRSKTSEKRVPGLSSIPLIGKLLFTSKSNDKASREVAVFVTAHLVPASSQSQMASATNSEAVEVPAREQPVAGRGAGGATSDAGDGEFKEKLKASLASQNK